MTVTQGVSVVGVAGWPVILTEPTGDMFTPHERAILLVFWRQRSRRNSNGVTPNGGVK